MPPRKGECPAAVSGQARDEVGERGRIALDREPGASPLPVRMSSGAENASAEAGRDLPVGGRASRTRNRMLWEAIR